MHFIFFGENFKAMHLHVKLFPKAKTLTLWWDNRISRKKKSQDLFFICMCLKLSGEHLYFPVSVQIVLLLTINWS